MDSTSKRGLQERTGPKEQQLESLLLTLCAWGGVHGTRDDGLGPREAHRRLWGGHGTELEATPLPSSCSTPQSLTCPGILRVGRVPPGNRDDMKGWKRGWESAIFILYFP